MNNSGSLQPSSPETACSRIEALLRRHRITLTMGGEPTFVPLDPKGDEWSLAALGPSKLGYARAMALHLIESSWPGALMLQTYGKTYPGEPLPRWNIVIEMRHRFDQSPLWNRPQLLTSDQPPARPVTAAQASSLARLIARRLGFADYLMRFREVESGRAPAWVLPLLFDDETMVFQTARWTLEKKQQTLIPGDSTAGLRLPLDRLAPDTPRKALVIQAQDSAVMVFIPPLSRRGFDLLTRVVEESCQSLPDHSVMLAGYPPTDGSMFDRLILASDPGVLEINLPPKENWIEHRHILRQVYDAAHAVGLCARKFHFNGDIHGTGGGAHLAFGGATVEQSPFLTHPTLLRSVVRYWHNHPCLSYLFTGIFVGPGSQAPRVDESNPLLLQELELALSSPLPRRPTFENIYLPLRHFFVDAAGNTHRAEICLDKLWNLSSSNGCSGLIEFRAFETCESADELAWASLLIRAVITRLIHRPYTEPLRPWGNVLHDAYFLKPFLEQDLESILQDLESCNISLPRSAFSSYWARRFPHLGTFEFGENRRLDFYSAPEIWPLLSEVPSGSVTSRPVDVSNERIMALASHAPISRQGWLRCADIPFQLRTHGRKALRGIRFRALVSVNSLHPHLPVHVPLKIQWVDAASGMVTHSARFYPWNPGGKDYPGRPKTAEEAAQRRKERWVTPTFKPSRHGNKPPLKDQQGWTFDLRLTRQT
ncbi:MAG: transglutaminase family protein [Candidatus Methylacidiphilales bacterium]